MTIDWRLAVLLIAVAAVILIGVGLLDQGNGHIVCTPSAYSVCPP